MTTAIDDAVSFEFSPGFSREIARAERSALSRREQECLQLLAAGCGNSEIASRLAITLPTVAMHIANARRRLKAKTREHAIAIALTTGAIRFSPQRD